MASLNRVIIAGNLTRDPEVRYTPSGMPVADVSPATAIPGRRPNEDAPAGGRGAVSRTDWGARSAGHVADHGEVLLLRAVRVGVRVEHRQLAEVRDLQDLRVVEQLGQERREHHAEHDLEATVVELDDRLLVDVEDQRRVARELLLPVMPLNRQWQSAS